MLKIINNIQSHPRLLLSDNTGWMDAKAKKLYTEGKKIKDKPKLSWLSQAAAAAAMAESPAVMTAAGWTPHSDGTIKLDSFGKPDRMQLADNLSAIGGTAVTAPLATSPTFITSMLGGTAVDGLSYATTGRSWGGNIEYLTNGVIPESVGAFTNIGYALGPKAFNNMYSESLRLPFMLKMIGKFGDKATRVDAMARFMGMLSPTTPVAEYLHGMIQLPKITTPTIQSMLYWKPWRSSWKNGDSKGNMAERYYWSDYPNEAFEVVHDLEPGFHSVHFKTTQGTLPQDRKMGLFLAVANAIPEGEGLSTWGSLTPGGVHGLGRFGDLGFKLIGTRQLTMKNGLPINVPIWYKPLTFKPLTFKPENTRTFSPYKRKSKYPLSVQESLLDESLLETPVSEFDYSLPQKWVVDEHTGKTMLLSEYLKLYPNPEDVPWIDNYGEIVDKIQHNYENAMHRRRDYTFPYVGSNISYGAVSFKHPNNNTFLASLPATNVPTTDELFFPSHFAPETLRSGYELLDMVGNSKQPVLFAVTDDLSPMLSKLGFSKIGEHPAPFGDEVVNKHLMINDAGLNKAVEIFGNLKFGDNNMILQGVRKAIEELPFERTRLVNGVKVRRSNTDLPALHTFPIGDLLLSKKKLVK